MYKFIINLFSESDYESLLEDDKSKNDFVKVLIIPENFPNESPFVVIKNEINDDSRLNYLPIQYFNFNKFINPTHNNSNNIGTNSALMSHSPTHYKITKTFINKDDNGKNHQYSNENAMIKISLKKVNAFENSVKKAKYYNQFPEICDKVASFFRDFDRINPENSFGLAENDFIVFLVNNLDIKKYLDVVDDYITEKILKYPTFEGKCNSCGKTGQLYALTQGSTFDIEKSRKFLFRHPTRYKTNLTSKSPENFNICKECSKQIYDFFEYIKKYKFYKYVFPTTSTFDTNHYKDYSSRPIGILKMLKILYEDNRSQEFDYVMMITDPKLENIEFIYVNNFNYKHNDEENAINIADIPVYNSLEKFKNNEKEFFINKKRDKLTFLNELNFAFNNTFINKLFDDNIKSLNIFLKLLILEYNSIVRNFIFFQNNSLFDDKLYSKLFRKLISELIMNSNFRNEMYMNNHKIQKILLIYYKYLNMEPHGEKIIMEYIKLKEKMNMGDFTVDNDFEASYYIGQMFRYLLQNYEGDNRLNAFTDCIMNVHNVERLKKQLIEVLEKYSYNEYLNNKKFGNLMSNVLSYKFEKSYEDNKISLFTGYFDDNYFYISKKKTELKIQEKNDEI